VPDRCGECGDAADVAERLLGAADRRRRHAAECGGGVEHDALLHAVAHLADDDLGEILRLDRRAAPQQPGEAIDARAAHARPPAAAMSANASRTSASVSAAARRRRHRRRDQRAEVLRPRPLHSAVRRRPPAAPTTRCGRRATDGVPPSRETRARAAAGWRLSIASG
jgi:hypothetical protein